MPRKRLVLVISSSERNELEGIINHEGSSRRLVLRCKIILLTENGIPIKDIAEKLGLSKTTVNTWRQIFIARGMEGLKVKKRQGRPSKLAKQILFHHFPELSENVSHPLRKAMDFRAKSALLLKRLNTRFIFSN